MTKLASSLAAAAWLCAGWAAPCAAAPVTFSFTGSVTETTFVPNDPFAGAIGIGAAFSGSYTFDTTAADSNPFPTNGSYMWFGAPYQFTATIGGFTFSTSDVLSVNVANGAADQYSALACAGGPFCFASTWALFLEDLDGTAFAGDALPSSAPLLSAFETALFTYSGVVDDNQVRIVGQLGSLVCSAGCDPVGTPVPEPGTLVLVGTALAALRRRRRQGVALAPASGRPGPPPL
jgi:hypothetical protein